MGRVAAGTEPEAETEPIEDGPVPGFIDFERRASAKRRSRAMLRLLAAAQRRSSGAKSRLHRSGGIATGRVGMIEVCSLSAGAAHVLPADHP